MQRQINNFNQGIVLGESLDAKSLNMQGGLVKLTLLHVGGTSLVNTAKLHASANTFTRGLGLFVYVSTS